MLNAKLQEKTQVLLASIAALSLAALISQSSEIIDQYYTGKLGHFYLNLHNCVSTMSMAFASIGSILGFSILLLSSKNEEKTNLNVWSGICLTASLALPAMLIQMLCSQFMFRSFDGIPGKDQYVTLYIAANGMSIFLAAGASVLNLFKDRKGILLVAAASAIINLCGNEYAINYGQSDGATFTIIAWATLASKIAAVIICVYRIVKFCPPAVIDIPGFLRTGRRIILGESLWIIALSATPFVIMYIMNSFYSVQVANASALGYRLGRIFLTPWAAAGSLTVQAIGQAVGTKKVSLEDAGKFEHNLTVTVTSLCLILGGIVIASLGMPNDGTTIFFTLAPFAAHLIGIHSLRDTAILKVAEHSHIGASTDILGTLCVTIPLLIMGSYLQTPILTLAVAYLAPSMCRVLYLKYSAKLAFSRWCH
ncbi:MAG: hypothetical protein WCI18_07660 [Pseudomonadota bacterium]